MDSVMSIGEALKLYIKEAERNKNVIVQVALGEEEGKDGE